MFDSRLPHHAELALWESTGATSRNRWVRSPRSAPRHRDGTGIRDSLRSCAPRGCVGSTPTGDTIAWLAQSADAAASRAAR